MSYLNELNPRQREAAQHTEGPLLIIAGAGAGKTKTIVYRIAHLISNGVNPENILAVTFTNKAANEMRERVEKLLGEEKTLKRPVEFTERPTVRTFHSLGVMILRENFQKAALPKRFSILDRADSKKIIRDILKSEGYDPRQYDPAKILATISRQKGDFLTPEEYEDSGGRGDFWNDLVSTVWRKYDDHLQKNGALDFDDLLTRTVSLLKENPEIRKSCQNRWRYIHIDEYQDTNEVQYQLAKMLAAEHKNICAVGDIDQNIYTWRGATIKNIMSFEQDYEGTREIVLEENYRSTQNILKAANEIISKNSIRKEKNLFTQNGEGEKIRIYSALDEYDEAIYAVKKARELMADGVSPNEIAILYRANFQSRVLEEICLRYKLPHQIVGTRFFDRKEIKDVLSYIKAALNKNDFASLNRIINTPPRGIGKSTALKIHAGQKKDLTPAMKERVEKFQNFLEKIEKESAVKTPADIVSMIFKESGLENFLKEQGEDGLEKIQNIKELVSLAKKYDGLNPKEAMNNFLDDASLATDQDDLERKHYGVKLMTVHAAKGLEFDYVFVVGLESGLFPMERDNQNENMEDAEEERRLFYVALTRARKKLFLTWTNFRTIYGNKQNNLQSEFLGDISEEIIERENFNGEIYNGGDFGGNSYGDGNSIEYLIDY
ncbi:MAG TPA: UvrD-helicase domain-containing protein [Candidatus Paceibacterota bacterium]|nr:UvrD-helicase domain-containing protein [Candidatus Paceibacterota bacterium]HRZ34246.1 UvrD-helicase domain-containing protein [Candidatus Paceibacterota bacterium]